MAGGMSAVGWPRLVFLALAGFVIIVRMVYLNLTPRSSLKTRPSVTHHRNAINSGGWIDDQGGHFAKPEPEQPTAPVSRSRL